MIDVFKKLFAELKAATPSCVDIAREVDFEGR
jgi:hypothetical protein